MNTAVAIRRRNLSRPVQAAIEAGKLTRGLSYFDYGCGRGDDVRILKRRRYKVAGWDPNHSPSSPKRPADVVGINYVLNILPSKRKRAAALREAAGLARHTLIVAVRADKAPGAPWGDGVRTSAGTFQANFDLEAFETWLKARLRHPVRQLEPGIWAVDMTWGENPIKPNKSRRVSQQVRAYYATRDRADMPAAHFLDGAGRRYPYRTAKGRLDCNLLSAAVKRARLNKDKKALKKGLRIFARVCAKFVDGATQ